MLLLKINHVSWHKTAELFKLFEALHDWNIYPLRVIHTCFDGQISYFKSRTVFEMSNCKL